MENKRFWLGMLVMAVVFSVVVVGCGAGSAKLSGKYVNEQNSSEFYEFKEKNKMLHHASIVTLEGTYSVKDSVLELESISGIIDKATLSGDKKSFVLKDIFTDEDIKYIKEK